MPTILNKDRVKIIECPRDAMQGIQYFIPTDLKIKYIDQLLKIGFHTLDCGSFVSAKAIPQLRDTAEVLNSIDIDNSKTRLSVIVANLRGAENAMQFKQIDYLGYPFSISETFQKRNTNKSIVDSVEIVQRILDLCNAKGKEMVVYISMGFGNPYGEAWNPQLVTDWVGNLQQLGVTQFSISDTVGVSTPESIRDVYGALFTAYKDKIELGAHFHTRPESWKEKVDAAVKNGCVRFDGAIKGYGGCPMAEDELVGNMPTENLIEYFGMDNLKLDKKAFKEAFYLANAVFL